VRLEQDQRVVEQVGGFVGDLFLVAFQGRDDELGGLLADLLVAQRFVGVEPGGVRALGRIFLPVVQDFLQRAERLAGRRRAVDELFEEAGAGSRRGRSRA